MRSCQSRAPAGGRSLRTGTKQHGHQTATVTLGAPAAGPSVTHKLHLEEGAHLGPESCASVPAAGTKAATAGQEQARGLVVGGLRRAHQAGPPLEE